MSLLSRLIKRQPTSSLTEIQDLPAGSFKFIAVDVETANSEVGSICQIGIACVDDSGAITVHTQLVNPESHFDGMNISIHGISEEDVEDAPNFNKVFEDIAPLLSRNRLIQHSSFDSRAIRAACEGYGLSDPNLSWHDSVKIARKAWPEFKGNGGHGLGHLKQVLELDFQHHDAGEDARAAAEIVLMAEARTGLSFVELSKSANGRQYWQTPVKMNGSSEGPLFGQVAVFTGSLSISRNEAAALAAKAGITTKAGVSTKITLLIVGDQDLGALAPGQTKSSKHRKAEELIQQGHDIRILGETEFKKLLDL